MTIYILIRLDIDFYWTDIIGVYTTKERAEELKRENEEIEKDWDEWERYEYKILEKELQ